MDNREILAKNLNFYLDRSNLSPTEFARKLDYPETTVFNWLHGKNYPRIDRIQQMADFFGIMKSDLTEDKSIELEDIPGIIPLQKLVKIPILGEIACGEPILAYENIEGYFIADPTIVTGDFILRCKGDSMIDADIFEDDIVFIRQTPDVENGAIAAVLIDGDTTLKRFYKNGNQVILQPENKKYSPIIITEEDYKDVRILGEMVGVYTQRTR